MTLVFTSNDCEALLDHPSLIASLADAMGALSTGEAQQPMPPVMADPDPLGPAMVPMVATWSGFAVVKMLADVPRNRGAGRPAQRSTVALFDAESAECLALIDGRALTRLRTAAATAVATRALANPQGSVLGLLGAGALAIEHLRSHLALGYDKAVVWTRRVNTLETMMEQCPDGVEMRAAGSPAEVLAEADVVCTLTPSTEPLVAARDLRPGLHLNAVGSPPRPAFRELFPDVLAAADLVCVDDRRIALSESGNVRGAAEAGAIGADQLVGLGDVVSGRHPGRHADTDVTVFNSVGIGIQDLAAARLILESARARGAGTSVRVRD